MDLFFFPSGLSSLVRWYRRLTQRVWCIFVGRGATLIVGTLHRLGVRNLIVIPGEHTAAIAGIARRFRRGAVPHAGRRAMRLRIFEPGRDAAFTIIRSSFETGIPAVLLGAPGPLALDVLPALRVALRSRVPLVLLAPVPRPETDQTSHRLLLKQPSIFAPFCKAALRIESLELCETTLAQAWDLACAEPGGPVFVEIPAGMLGQRTLRCFKNFD